MNRELTQNIIEFIGYPPKSVTLDMIKKEFPDVSDKEFGDVMDYLWDQQLLQVWKNDSIAGRKPNLKMTLSDDDWDYLLGTGQYAQG